MAILSVLASSLAAAPAIALDPEAGRVEAGPSKAVRAHVAAAPGNQAARRRCPVKRRSRCLRIRHAGRRGRAAERLVPVPTPVPPPTAPPPVDAPGDAPSPVTPAAPLPRFVSVAAREWSLTLSRPVVGAGSVTVELRNVGEDPHDLVVSPDDGSHTPLADWPEMAPGTHLRQTVSLPAGRYLLFCSLEGHEAAGMSVRLRVE